MAMIVVPGRSEVQVLNSIGTQVWNLIDGQRTVGEIIERLVDEYDVAPDVLETDVRDFVISLDERDMLLQDEGK